MSALLWPGDDRAGRHFGDEAVVHAMLRVEAAWLHELVEAGVAPPTARHDLDRLVNGRDLAALASGAEASGNPVVPLLALLRSRLRERDADAAHWLHRGLTSQDVLDTALVLCARDTATQLATLLERQVAALVALAHRHRDDVMVGRTLTQHAVPITFGLKAAHWLQGVLDARDALAALVFPAQVGGAAGTLSAVAELVALTGAARGTGTQDDGAPVAGTTLALVDGLVDGLAHRVGLEPAVPWHTTRTPFTAYADALVRAHDAWGHLAGDVLVLARPEIAELAEPAVEGRGGSSTMPQKSNPVLSVLVRRAASTAPALAAQLHLAAAGAVDERPDGAWHTEWATLATLSRRTLTSASQVAELLEGLHVDTGAMASVVHSRASALLAEQRSIRGVVEQGATDGAAPDFDPAHYLGATGALIDRVLARASAQQEDL
ncbi:MAG: putative 3-carboxy-cis,cis-muconate cycloisomerase [Marmoricola sp.]|nr:putative 3-carboxy-cis,cis-muconate cycloisomerase [Marmoricola sp.]